MANSNYEDKLLDAIEAVVNNAVKKAGYDRTIQCQIVECLDATIGKYKVKYQDSTFIAYSGNTDIPFMNGADVYVLVPGNDMTREKQILGTTKKLGTSLAGVVFDQDAYYEQVGGNCIDESGSYSFSSYKDEIKVIYDKTEGINDLHLNLQSIETYIRRSSSLLCGGMFQTQLPIEQQYRGNFGVVFELSFLDKASDNSILRNYVVDVNQMLGNPYKQTKWTRQYAIFDFDVSDFQYINRIYLFVDNFPHKADDKPTDIFIKDLELFGVELASEAELNSYGLSILTPDGTYFELADAPTAVKNLQAQLKLKGKNIDNTNTDIQYYWFVENVSITLSNPLYCVYGGQGWECKNSKNKVGTDSNGEPVYEWVPAKSLYTVLKQDVPARETRFKCVAVYNDVIISKEVVITNYASEWDITVESDSGDRFYHGIGAPTLVCKINDTIKTDDNFTYMWAVTDCNNIFLSLSETTDANKEYNDAVAGYNNLLASIEAEQSMAAASEEQLNGYLTIIEKYDKIKRIEKMYIHKLQVKEITNFSTYTCSVYNNGIFIGSNSIIIYNSNKSEGFYSLVINNGTQTFKYDEMGLSPVITTLDTPIELKDLTFTVYDNQGNIVDNHLFESGSIKWYVPNDNTLLNVPYAYGTPSFRDDVNHYDVYDKGLLAFTYLINNRYDITRTHNNIMLQIDYEDISLTAETNFSFIKEGEPGTNGTEFAASIVPNTSNSDFNEYPMILNGELNYTPDVANQWFRVQFWHNGDMIFDGAQSGITTENNPITLQWSILQNIYNKNESDNTDIEITDAEMGLFNYIEYVNNSSPANIIKCTINYLGLNYYATIPMITGICADGYGLKLKKGSGFRFATYSADGRRPQYDNSNPFEIIVTKVINGYVEDVSRLEKAEAVDYEWLNQGKIYNPVTELWEYNDYLLEQSTSVEKNQKRYKPVDAYNGECVNVGLECIISGGSVGRIHIPVHLLLNKYGQSAINDWDGNHVSIDENGSGVILAPQVGAGRKEDDNSFSGALMGEVKETGQSNADVGIFGYYRGRRTFYLSAFDGYAIFGKQGPGQIILDPTADYAMLYSNNFWERYNDDNTDTKKNGLPITDYSYPTPEEQPDPLKRKYKGQADAGMLIDLTTPRILFGSGNFRVEPDGFMYAKGGGQIAGWKIDDNRIYSASGVGDHPDITIDSSIPAIYSNDKDAVSSTRNGFYIGSDGFALGKYNENRGHNPFQVNEEGYLYSESGTIGGWNITTNNLGSTNNRVIMSSNGDIDCSYGDKWYIHNDGTASFGKLKIYDGKIEAPGLMIDGDTLTSLEAQLVYIQGQLAETQAGAQSKATTAQNNASSHADTVAGNAQRNANSYTDGKFANGKSGEIEIPWWGYAVNEQGSTYTFTNGLLTNINNNKGPGSWLGMVSSFMPSLLSGQNGQTYTDTFRAGELLSKDITLTFTNGLLTGHQVK